MKDNTKRFSGRATNYAKYRPSYPADMIDYLINHFEIDAKNFVADIGSGTGKLTELLLPICKTVYAVEPNLEMRVAAERKLGKFKNFKSIAGTAENTTLRTNSIDTIAVAQAFHWFDIDRTKMEFTRILRRYGTVIIITNKRRVNTPFLEKYEETLRKCIPEYEELKHNSITSDKIKMFYKNKYEQESFGYQQIFDWNGLVGRLSSSSYTPKTGTPEYKMLLETLNGFFEKHAVNGKVEFNYETIAHSGTIN